MEGGGKTRCIRGKRLNLHLSVSISPFFSSSSFSSAVLSRRSTAAAAIAQESVHFQLKWRGSLGCIKGARGCTALWLQLRVGGCEGGRVTMVGLLWHLLLGKAPRKEASIRHSRSRRGGWGIEVRGDRKTEKRTIRVFKSPTKFRLKS